MSGLSSLRALGAPGKRVQSVRHNLAVSLLPSFADLASDPEPAMGVLALAVATEFRCVDARATIAMLDVLGGGSLAHRQLDEWAHAGLAIARGQPLGREQGFVGDRQRYDDPEDILERDTVPCSETCFGRGTRIRPGWSPPCSARQARLLIARRDSS